MTNEEAKQILSAYRPSGADASDPVFERALAQAKRDPELAAWFKQERASDAELARVFQSIPVPEEAKRSLLALAQVKPAEKKSFWGWTTAVAAGFAVMLGLTTLLMPYLRPVPEVTLQEPESIGVVELAGLARVAMPLDFRGDSVPELRAWLAGRGAPAPGALPEGLGSLSAVGCRVFSDEHGNSISLLCLQKDGQLVHLFVAEGDARGALAMAEKEWISQDGWNAYCWSDEDRPEKIRESLDQVAELAPDRETTYTLLSDSKMTAAQAFGITFQVDASLVETYRENHGIDLEDASGERHHLLPHPAVFVVTSDKIIRFAQVDTDYKVRLSGAEIVSAAQEAK